MVFGGALDVHVRYGCSAPLAQAALRSREDTGVNALSMQGTC